MNMQCLFKVNDQSAGQKTSIPEEIVGHGTPVRHHVLCNCTCRPLFLNQVFCITIRAVDTWPSCTVFAGMAMEHP